MTGAGSSSLAYVYEDSYNAGPPGSPTYYRPGKDPQTQPIELSNALSRLRDAGDVTPSTNLAENLEGAFGVSWILQNNEYHNLIFSNDADSSGTNDEWATGLFPSSTWFTGVDYPSGGSLATAERQLTGVVPTECRIVYNQGEDVRVDMTCVYADETLNTSLTPGTISQSGNPVPGHGASLSIDSTTVSKLQSAALNLGPLARPQRGPSRYLVDAVQAATEPTLDVAAIFTGADKLKQAYDGTGGSSSPQDDVGSVSGSLTFSDATGSTVADYSLSGMTLLNYDWQDLINPDTDLTDPVTYAVNGVSADA